jgi:hypothetical protein
MISCLADSRRTWHELARDQYEIRALCLQVTQPATSRESPVNQIARRGAVSKPAELDDNTALVTEAVLIVGIRERVGIPRKHPIGLSKSERDPVTHAYI